MGQDVLLVINEAPYGSEKPFDALRLAIALQAAKNNVHLFLLADAVYCGLPSQSAPEGHYNIGEMLERVIGKGGRVAACGTCMKSRGMSLEGMIKGVEQGSMVMLSEWTEKCTRSLSF